MKVIVDAYGTMVLDIDDATSRDQYGNDWSELVTKVNSGDCTPLDVTDALEPMISDMDVFHVVSVGNKDGKVLVQGDG